MIGRIYKITSSNTEKVYIGSTTKKLTERLRRHEIDYKAFQNGKQHFIKSYDILEHGDYKIELLEKIEYEAKTELFKREGYYIRKYRDICVNRCVAGRTYKQYYKDNAHKIREVNRQYYRDNADKIKQYCKDNIEKIKDRHRQYRKDNMVKITEQRKEKFECVCGKTYTRSHKIRHEKSQIHIAFNKQ